MTDLAPCIEAFDEDAQRHTQESLFSADRELPRRPRGTASSGRLDARRVASAAAVGGEGLVCELYEQSGLDQFWGRADLRRSREGTNCCDT